MKIKVKLFNKDCEFNYIKKGEWIDLKSAEEYITEAPIAKRARKDVERDVIFKYHMIPLGIGMKLPEGYEAIIVPRSSTFKSYGILQVNNVGVIDSTYSGPNDQWKYPCIDIIEGKKIEMGDRICQFRIQLSQKATIWQKIKWLFTNKIEFEFVDDYGGENRGGFGTTGK
jgi:dUTP pyrophosphatase